MYEKEIKTLTEALEYSAEYYPALQAAIALMRAAEPKDEAAEREHCQNVVNALCEHSYDYPYAPDVTDKLLRERAAARAEGFKAGCKWALDMDVKPLQVQVELLREVKSDAMAQHAKDVREIERFSNHLAMAEAEAFRLRTERAQLKAQLEELHEEWRRFGYGAYDSCADELEEVLRGETP
jgi:hypothetical protein